MRLYFNVVYLLDKTCFEKSSFFKYAILRLVGSFKYDVLLNLLCVCVFDTCLKYSLFIDCLYAFDIHVLNSF